MAKPAITTVKTVVERIERDGNDIKIFTLTDPDRWELPPFKPGAHIDLHLSNRLVRTFSLCNDPIEADRYVLAVKREPEGRGGSIAMHDHVNVGDTIGVSLPRGGLTLERSAPRYIFVAGGVGVTPFVSAARYLQRIGHANFKLHLISRDRPTLAAELATLIDQSHVEWHDTRSKGRPEIARIVGKPDQGTVVSCSGPESMLEAFEDAVAGWPQENVHIERFVAPFQQSLFDKPYTLVLGRSGREVPVRSGEAMLAALQAADIDIPNSCCGGICGACKVGWLEGKPKHRDRVLSAYERERFLMVCVAGSDADRLVLDL